MKPKIITVVLALITSSFAFAQAENEVICKSISNPTNIQVFEGEACPFGWVSTDDAE